AALVDNGSALRDKSGLATSRLAACVQELSGYHPQPGPLADLLRRMEEDGQIVREIAGRRTFAIEVGEAIGVALLTDAAQVLLDAGRDAAVVARLLVRVPQV